MDRMPLSASDAHQHAMSMPIGLVVRDLVALLGLTTVAALGGVKETRAVNQWLEGRDPQRPHVLRFALQIAAMLSTLADKSTVQAWFAGANPHLEGRSPVALLHNRPTEDAKQLILAAATHFALREGRLSPPESHS